MWEREGNRQRERERAAVVLLSREWMKKGSSSYENRAVSKRNKTCTHLNVPYWKVPHCRIWYDCSLKVNTNRGMYYRNMWLYLSVSVWLASVFQLIATVAQGVYLGNTPPAGHDLTHCLPMWMCPFLWLSVIFGNTRSIVTQDVFLHMIRMKHKLSQLTKCIQWYWCRSICLVCTTLASVCEPRLTSMSSLCLCELLTKWTRWMHESNWM